MSESVEEIYLWEDAEELAALHMRRVLGFRDAKRMPDGADGGIDVRSERAIAQVKFLATPVGRPDIQRLAGVFAGGERRVFYSFSGYSKQATEEAEHLKMALFSFDRKRNVEPVNKTANDLVKANAAHALPLVENTHSKEWGWATLWFVSAFVVGIGSGFSEGWLETSTAVVNNFVLMLIGLVGAPLCARRYFDAID
ncbi:restriction endonuclease [Aeromicrobium duanguangcaii]|uniref:Restriction endonuclease n=1 Tax=Aeromicrobium duanguangcaii TaxID=2968086 RepID=A0ABY5KJ34_9ACTN|nr:restriction endonuclease [Aeromicrobium duanguangcaii]MCD9153110.1 restriction endonuclease [Aeromicrobium duanguangcaii]UUI69789.1 restriction endonuclease [Aeromicrobium duanguangcaii]